MKRIFDRLPGRIFTAVTSLLVLGLYTTAARAQNLLQNGDFEIGLAGWTVQNQQIGPKYDPSDPQQASGGYFAMSYADGDLGTLGNQLTTPISQLTSTPDTTALAGVGGTGFALADMNALGTHALFQSFIAPLSGSVNVSWSMFVYNWYGDLGAVAPGAGLNHTGANPNQFGRVDILTASSAASDPFTSSVVATLFGPSVDPEAASGQEPLWRAYNASVTGLTNSERYALRFAVTDNQFVLNMAVDQVSVTANGSVAPEPTSGSFFSLVALGTIICAAFALKRRKVIVL